MAGLSARQGEMLVRLARQTLNSLLGVSRDEEPDQQALSDAAFQQKQGVFVTLKKNGELRGCIGSLVGTEPLVDAIRHQTENAALQDHRFSPVRAEELARIKVEISILSPPKPLTFSDPSDLLAKLRPHVDGVILGLGNLQATFLPQVWEQLPRPEEFLAHLAMKAGLSSQAWRTEGVTIATYQVQHFSE
ncbi:MAG: AmmeMemoRadiSam system protein A [Desulfobulbaceae bacterium]|nr:MAG: AmmeMemoRadiSam system protein A [Desulfobulbaceae bacterium]